MTTMYEARVRREELSARVSRGEGVSEVAREMGISRQRVHQLANYQKHQAREVLSRAVASGAVVPSLRCQACANGGRIEGHHADYAKPLAVIWLCPPCHTLLHAHAPPKTRLEVKRCTVCDVEITWYAKHCRACFPRGRTTAMTTISCEVCSEDFSFPSRLITAYQASPRYASKSPRFCSRQCWRQRAPEIARQAVAARNKRQQVAA